MKVIGVIGAGASGLCALRHILATTDLTPVAWEQSADLGGTWRLSEDVGTDKSGLPVHSSIYQNLKCDLPKAAMAFPDFPFPKEGDDFVHHTVVLKYLEDYADHHNLLPLIKFGHHVEKVSPVLKEEGEPPTWEVTVKELSNGMVTTTTCDALLICNGHFSVPAHPDIVGIEDFKGKQMHSHDYREPSPYAGRRVVVVGAGASGLDISLELSSVAEQVFLSHNFPVLIPSDFPPNITQVSSVQKATPNELILSDGQRLQADDILYCTGYKYTFPFLSDECGISVDNNHVKPLYKHIINAVHPSMGFIGVPSRIIVFPLINYQVRYFLATVTGQAALPSTAEMMITIETSLKDLQLKGKKEKELHLLSSDQFCYMQDLATCASLEPPPPFLKKLWDIVIPRLIFSFPIFKSYSYEVSNNGSVVESRNGRVLSTGKELTLLTIRQLIRLVWMDFYRVTWVMGSAVWNKIFSFIQKKN